MASVTTPVGNEFRWSWATAGDGPRVLNVTQYDSVGARAWDQHTVSVNNLGPATTWKNPTNGATVTDPITLKASASDYYAVNRVEFYVDTVDGYPEGQDTTPDSGTSDYTWLWDPCCVGTGSHTLTALAYDDNNALRKSTSVAISVTVATDPQVMITTPTNGQNISGDYIVMSSASSASSTISKVEYFVDSALKSSPTTSPYSWRWPTSQYSNGQHLLAAIAYRASDGKTAMNSIMVTTSNGGGGGCPPNCPDLPNPGDEPPPSPPSQTLGILATEWALGETDVGPFLTIVVDLTGSPTGGSAAENASRILRPGLPTALFLADLEWRLVVRDWSVGTAGNVTAFTLRFETESDPSGADLNGDGIPDGMDTDGDGIRDGTEANYWRTLPVTRDSDLDGLSDDYEIAPHTLTVRTDGTTQILTGLKTDPAKWDTDGDGLSDGQERGFVTMGQSKVIGEVGRVSGITGSCSSPGATTVYLRNRYTAAVVIAEPATKNEADTGVVRVKAVGDHSFDVCFQEWSGSTTHAAESVDYLVLESGNHVLPDGSVIEAGRVSAGTAFATFLFREGFAQPPILLGQVQSYADPDIAAARVRSVTFTGFDARIRVNAGDAHPSETVGYVAVAPQADPTVLATWTRGSLTVGASTNPTTVAFPRNFSTTPRFLAWYATEASTDELSLRVQTLTNASATLMRENPGTPAAETLHWFAFAGSMNLTARMVTRPNGTGSADTDGDTLSDGAEVNTYGSNPTLKDTDADGIPDNVEVADQTITIPVNGTMKSFTFKTSPTSDDTDADGIKDPDELSGILDHRTMFYDMSTLGDSSHLRDLSGNGNLGTLSGPTNTTDANKLKVGQAMDFDGVNDKVSTVIPGLSKQGSWSVSLWFKWDNGASASSSQYLFAVGQAYDASVYMAKANKSLMLKATDASGNAVVHVVLVAFSSTASTQVHHIAATFDGTTLRAYVDGVAKGPWSTASVRVRSDSVKLGTSGSETGNYFDGRLDEVQVWDRRIASSEVTAYYNTTNAAGLVGAYDMDTLTSAGKLNDFAGVGHPGTLTGTSTVPGRSGLARHFGGGSDGLALDATTGVSFAAGVAISLYVFVSAYPTADAPLVARKASVYLNLTSDGRIKWEIYRSSSVATSLPIVVDRWVHVAVTASSAGLSVYLDEAKVAGSTSAITVASPANGITAGYGDGIQGRFIGNLDELAVFSYVPTSWTLGDLRIRGIVTLPAFDDTDYDGVSDYDESVGYNRRPTDPVNADTDADGLIDGMDLVPTAYWRPTWRSTYEPGLVRFTQRFNAFGIHGESAYIYTWRISDGACVFYADDTADSTRSSDTSAPHVRDVVNQVMTAGGETNYTALQATYVMQSQWGIAQYTYGGCVWNSPRQYRIGYTYFDNLYDVDLVNTAAVTIIDDAGQTFFHSTTEIPVAPSKTQSVLIQATIRADADQGVRSSGSTKLPAFMYSLVRGTDFPNTPAFYRNIAVGAPIDDHSYQFKLRIPKDIAQSGNLVYRAGAYYAMLILTPIWVTAAGGTVTKTALDPSAMTINSMTMRKIDSASTLIVRTSLDPELVEAALPGSISMAATGYYQYGPYRVYVYRLGSTFDASAPQGADALYLTGASQEEIADFQDDVVWAPTGAWRYQVSDSFANTFGVFKQVQESVETSSELVDGLVMELQNMRASKSEQLRLLRSTIQVEKYWNLETGRYQYSVWKFSETTFKTQVPDNDFPMLIQRTETSTTRETKLVEVLDNIEDSKALAGVRLSVLRKVMTGAAIGAVLVVYGSAAFMAFLDGDVVKGTFFAAATAVSILGIVYSEKALVKGLFEESKFFGKGALKAGAVATVAVSVVLAGYEIYLAHSTSDPIKQLSHYESASAEMIDGLIAASSPYGVVVLSAWSVGVYGAVLFMYGIFGTMPDTLALKIVSSPGATVVFFWEYVWGTDIPSDIAEDAIDQLLNFLANTVRFYNSSSPPMPAILLVP